MQPASAHPRFQLARAITAPRYDAAESPQAVPETVLSIPSATDGWSVAPYGAPYPRRVTESTATNGKAGASARREGERRRAKREAAVRARHPRIGGVILALRDAPQHERSWARGAGGEELVEQALTKHAPTVVVLHDRRIPGSRANIDHIAIASTGVWVIDSKRYKGKLQVAKPLFGKPTLQVAGRDQTKLVDGLAKQVDLVTAAVADIGLDVAVHGCMCFVDTELPLFGTPTINGCSIFGRRGLAKQLNAAGVLAAADAAVLATALARIPVA